MPVFAEMRNNTEMVVEGFCKSENVSKKKSLKKNRGRSWIKVKKIVYTFNAGKTVQEGLEQVYGVLEDLIFQMETESYEHENGIILQYVDGETTVKIQGSQNASV